MKSSRIMLFSAVVGLSLSLSLGACKPEPNLAQEHRVKGNDLWERADFKGAASEWEQSLAVDPKQEKLFDKIAAANMKAGDTDKAAEFLIKSLEFKKDDKAKLDVYRNVAGMYLQKSDGEKAEKYFNEALKIDPKDEQSLTWLAELASQRGGARNASMPAMPEHLDRAIALYDQVLAINPNSQTAIVNKRIALTKYVMAEQSSKTLAEQEAKDFKGKSKDVVDAANARAQEHADKAAKLQAELDATTKRLSDVMKASAGKK